MKEESPVQIPFVQEVLRKTTHMIALVIPGGYHFLGLEKRLVALAGGILRAILPHDPGSRTTGRFHRGDLHPHFGVCHSSVV